MRRKSNGEYPENWPEIAQAVMERPWLFEHSAWFRPYAAGYYAFTILGLDLSRDEVESRLDELLALGQPWLISREMEAQRA